MKNLRKQAAEAIKELRNENKSLKEDISIRDIRDDLFFKLYKQGSVSAEDLERLYDTLREKTKEELTVIEKAAEMNSNSNYDFSSMGFSVGDRFHDNDADPLTRCLLEDL